MHVIELRQYTLKPNQREVLVELFEREFVESQEAQGMRLIGTFLDMDDPDRFVWLRGFEDMDARKTALGSFYGGPVWKTHRDAANATMLDSDNVLLLRPAWNGSGFVQQKTQAPPGDGGRPPGVYAVTTCHFGAPVDAALLTAFGNVVPGRCVRAGAELLAVLVTEPSVNTFPALPVREGTNVLTWVVRFADAAAALAGADCSIPPRAIVERMSEPEEILRLQPTARSRLR